MGNFISFINSYMKLVFTKCLLINIYMGPTVRFVSSTLPSIGSVLLAYNTF